MIADSRDLQMLKMQISGPMLWSESYQISGMHQGTYTLIGDGRPLKQFTEYWYTARCLICENHETAQFSDQNAARFNHFVHCCRQHGYVFPEDEARSFFQVSDKQLQDAIIVAMEHEFPMPGYEDHSKCIKQHRDDKQICVVHIGNEYKHKVWMGQY